MFATRSRFLKLFFALVFGVGASLSASSALATPEDEAAGKELTTLFRAARKVISDNQELINDASKGNKGLAADRVVELTKANYQQATGVPLNLKDDGTLVGKGRVAMINGVRDVMTEAQALINEQGKGFKGFLPAVFASRVAGKFSKAMGGKVSIKLTAPKAYLRNRANKPDDWESNVIETMFKSPSYARGKPFFENASVAGKSSFRYILPEYYGASCLACHGDPKGATDISGGKKEGAKLDELGGAISLVIQQ